MTALRRVREELVRIGYSVIRSDYVFSDVFAPSPRDRMVQLAAFTHTPTSYRNAAVAVIDIEQGTVPETTGDYRALGAPLLFVIEGEQVAVCQLHPDGRRTVYRRTTLDQLSHLFSEHREVWTPSRIHRAKSFGLLNKAYQLSFVDAGLLPAVEGEIHSKLDRLLNETLADIVRLRVIRPGEQVNERVVFRTVFRLLAAKVLQDRGHELAYRWNAQDIDSVLKNISGFYQLPKFAGEGMSLKGSFFDAAWNRLQTGISFANISSDDLAFVYENTLVTKETRKYFGTHSTPRPLAEYVVSRLGLEPHHLGDLKIYEPFAGAGVFMVAALRHVRDLLPAGMTELEQHRFLVNRISGDEIEPFAAEVARLSLILADYPNENGWNVSEIDLFENDSLVERTRGARVVLCNPPFELFNNQDRQRYPKAVARSPRKPIAALQGVLDAKPASIGFVLPEPFIDGQQYLRVRERIENLYKGVEVVSLPDRVFKASQIRSSLLIANEIRTPGYATTALRSVVVSVRDRERFLKYGDVSETRSKSRPFGAAPGRLWIGELDDVWEALAALPKLRSVAQVHKGIEWQGDQREATRDRPAQGFRRGVHSADSVHAFTLDEPVYLDCRPERLLWGAIHFPWSDPKILANASRLSRGPWCFAAAIDRTGLVASQQLFGIWPTLGASGPSLNALCALLNNPVAVAYIASHSPPDRIRVGTVGMIPIPGELPAELDGLVERYASVLRDRPVLLSSEFNERSNRALSAIDAAVLAAYDLPPRTERRVLEYFRGEGRPTTHEWTHWFPEDFAPFIPLHEYLSDDYKEVTRPWVQEVFSPLPAEDAEALLRILE